MTDTTLYKKILFADDDEAFRFTIKEYFSDSPWTFDMAENGVVALDKALGTKYDLVILDINMPFMKGNETVKEIKNRWPGVRVLAFTAYASHDVTEQYLKDGFDDVISKHIELGLLHKIISEHLRPGAESKSSQSIRNSATLQLKTSSKSEIKSEAIQEHEAPVEILLARIKQIEQEKQNLILENAKLKEKIMTLEKQLNKFIGLQ